VWHKLFCNTQLIDQQEGSPLTSECNQHVRRGALLLRELQSRSGLLTRLVQCFDDHRDPELVEHTVEELVQ
jgi:hypothetical protein